MVDEWVSVRAMLADDPKTIAITEFLKRQKTFREWLGVQPDKMNQEALCSVTLSALIRVWAIANSRGVADETDVLLAHASLSWVDRIGKVPGLGKAMDSVHWAIEEQRNGVTFIRLPNFLEYNIPVEVRSDKQAKDREKNRERQRRFRERHKLGNAAVTPINASTETASDRSASEPSANAVAGNRKGVQGERDSQHPVRPTPQLKFKGKPVPAGFKSAVTSIFEILDLGEHTDEMRDQYGFLAKLAYAGCSGFVWPNQEDGSPHTLWSLIDKAKVAKRRRANPNRNSAGYLTKLLQDELGEKRWKEFQDEYPNGSHCHWLMAQLDSGKIQESFE
jgi:hypothetical protein